MRYHRFIEPRLSPSTRLQRAFAKRSRGPGCRASMTGEFARHYQHCLGLLRARMPEGVRWTTPGGGPVPWLERPRRVAPPELVESMADPG